MQEIREEHPFHYAEYYYLFRGASLTRNHTHLGPYSRTMPMFLRRSLGGGVLLARYPCREDVRVLTAYTIAKHKVRRENEKTY